MTIIAAAQIRLAIRNADVAIVQLENFLSVARLLTGLSSSLDISSTRVICDLRIEMARLTDLLATFPVTYPHHSSDTA